MPEISPFRGIRYRGLRLEDVLAPPYDVIPPDQRDALYARHPRNVVRLVLNREPGDAGYADAGAAFEAWRRDGTLALDDAPCLYLLEQQFEWEGSSLSRVGLLARFRATDPGEGKVLPHEQTRPGPREDRWRMLLATRANFSPIFTMVPDAEGRFASLAAAVLGRSAAGDAGPTPAETYTDDGGTRHRLFPIEDAGLIAGFRDCLSATKAYIADGHHRYATALRYRDANGPAGAWTLGYFTPMEAPGLLVLPYHRILSEGPSLAVARQALEGQFLLSDAADAASAARQAAHSTMPYAFGLAFAGGGALVAEALPGTEDLFDPATPESLRALDTQFFHAVVLRQLLDVGEQAVSFVHSLREAEQAVAAGRCRFAALMRGTPVRQIVDVAEARESMPAKSTFFHPKLPSGLVIHPLAV